jgi:tetratricopeptide (TPR) repeat protein
MLKKFLLGLVLICFAGMHQELLGQKKKSNEKLLQESDSLSAEKIFLDAEKYFILEDYAKSLNLFQKSLEIIPDNAAAHYKMAQILYYEQDYPNALGHALNAKALNPKNKFYYKIIAECYRALNNLAEAANTYEEMLVELPESNEVLLDLALIYIYLPDYQKALDTYNKAESALGISEEVILQKQKIYLKINDIQGAIQEAEKLVALNPMSLNYLLNMVKIYTSNGREADAAMLLEEFKSDYPDVAEAYLELYFIYNKLGEYTKAEQNLNYVFANPKVDPRTKAGILSEKIKELPNKDVASELEVLIPKAKNQHPESEEILAIEGDFYLKLGKKEEARDAYIKAAELSGSSYDLWQNILSLSFELEDFESAVEYSETALEFFPNQGYLHYINGVANYALEDYGSAASAFENSKKISRNNLELKAEINARLGDTYHSLTEYEKSDAAYDEALAYNPNFDHVLNNYSYFLSLRKERLEDARRMSGKLVKRNPDNPTFLDTHGWVLYNLGEYKEAEKYLEKAVAGDPSPVILEHYGDVLFKLGRVEEAVEQWEKAKGLDSTSELIDKKIADRKLYE